MNADEAGETTTDRLAARFGSTLVRWLLGLMWLSNLNWKLPPDFGGIPPQCGGFCGHVQAGIDHPVVPGSSWAFEHLVAPNLALFGWVALLVETAVAAMLLSGRFLRVAALLSIAQSVAIGLAVANMPLNWYWSYLLMVGLSVAVLVHAPVTRPTRPRVMALVVAAYGTLLAASHASASLTGDGNTTWSLFSGGQAVPDEFGKAVFPGSVGLGLIFLAGAVLAWVLTGAGTAVRRMAGTLIVGVAAVLLLTYRADGLSIGLGSRATTSAALAMVGLGLLPDRTR
jgi:hypothetical protein